MSRTGYTLAMIAVIAGVTAALRALPFLVFRRKTPRIVLALSRSLPYAVMGMLVVYCLRGVSLTTGSHGIPEAVSIAVVVLLHRWRHNTLLSVFTGTVVYMLLVQVVF